MKIALITTHWDILDDTYILRHQLDKYFDKAILLIDKEQDTRGYDKMLCRDYGYDMWKYKEYLEHNIIAKDDEYLLINNTISAIKPLWCLFDYLVQSECSFIAATDAYTSSKVQKNIGGWYAQSYFLYLRWQALELFNGYMLKTNIKNDKWYIIDKFEFGLSRLMVKNKVKIDIYLPVKKIIEKYKECRYDPYIYFETNWKVIVKKQDWEFNWIFIRPDIYIEEWLPFVKNTSYSNWFNYPLVQLLANKIYHGT